VIYLDSSVALAHLLAEDRTPPRVLWRKPLIASRLLEYEVWTRLNARGLGPSHGEEARALIHRVALIELAPEVLERALESFPTPVRTLDALHLASIEFLRGHGQLVELASYDQRLTEAALALDIPIAALAEKD
jgi:predicted nucleic acid-binding protein